MTVSHPLPYPTDFIELAIPDTGAAISTEVDWRPEEPTIGLDGETDPRLRFSRSPMPPDSEWSFRITGFPNLVIDSDGNRIQQRDEVSEMLIGAVVLVIVGAIVAITGYSWTQQPPAETDQESLTRRTRHLILPTRKNHLQTGLVSKACRSP